MKTLNLILLICLISINKFYSQYNYVQNWNFETVIGNPNCSLTGGMLAGSGFLNPNQKQLDMEALWLHAAPWMCPGQRAGLCFKSAGSTDFKCTDGLNSSHCVFFGSGEFVCQPLVQSLTFGKSYYVEYWAKCGNYTLNNGVKPGLRFLNDRPQQCGNKRIKKGKSSPNVEVPNFGNVFDNQWLKVKANVVADGNFSWLNFGHYGYNNKKYPDIGGLGSFFLDNVKIIEVGSSFCPPLNLVQNIFYDDIGEITYRSLNQTIAGNSVDNSKPFGDVIISSTSTVALKSENEVAMLPGLSVNAGASFKAYIAPCGDECASPSANAGDDIIICGNSNNISIGSNPLPGNTYNWTLSPETQALYPNALNYLSSTTVSNPVLTLPNIAVALTYNLNVTNLCNVSATDEITIKYEPSPNANAFINMTFGAGYNFFTFNANISPHTEYVYIELYDQDGNLIEEDELEVGVDFPAGATSVSYSNYNVREACKAYQLIVYTKNLCVEPTSVPVSQLFSNTPPNNNSTVNYISNIFTPNGDGVNDCFGASVNDIAICKVRMYSGAWNVLLHQQEVSLANGFNCLWNGFCTAGGPNCACNCLVSDGVYSYILEFKNCSGAILYTESNYVTKLGSPGQRMMNLQNQNSDSATVKRSLKNDEGTFDVNRSEMLIYPNPNDGVFTINFTGTAPLPQTIEIENVYGESVYKLNSSINLNTKIDLSGLAKGVYIVRATMQTIQLTSKIVIQ